MSRRRVSDEDIDYSDDGLALRAGERFTGIVEDLFPDGRPQFETEYRLGILDGLSRTFWPDGALHRETWYDYGVKLRERSWYASGGAQEDMVLDRDGLKHHYRYAEDGSVEHAYNRGVR